MYAFSDIQNKNVKKVQLRVERCDGGVRREENSRRLLHRYSRKILGIPARHEGTYRD